MLTVALSLEFWNEVLGKVGDYGGLRIWAMVGAFSIGQGLGKCGHNVSQRTKQARIQPNKRFKRASNSVHWTFYSLGLLAHECVVL